VAPKYLQMLKMSIFGLSLKRRQVLLLNWWDDPLLLDSLSVAADDDCLVVDLLAVAHYNHDSDIGGDLVIPVCELLHNRLDLLQALQSIRGSKTPVLD
jgi:hypothetical protein